VLKEFRKGPVSSAGGKGKKLSKEKRRKKVCNNVTLDPQQKYLTNGRRKAGGVAGIA